VARIEHECGRGAQVALVIVGVTTPEMTDLDWLEHVHELCPRASRCAIVHYGDEPLYPMFRRALLLGQVDTYLVQPQGNPAASPDTPPTII
jgi:response regulator RpfG family c-di-GMP phosphodiesterase